MDKDRLKELSADADGLLTYEYLANHIDSCDEDMDFLVDNMIKVDQSGQFLVSAARYRRLSTRRPSLLRFPKWLLPRLRKTASAAT